MRKEWDRAVAAGGPGGGGGGCARCRGPLITIRKVFTGEFYSATLAGKPLSGEEAEANKCPNCARKLDTGEGPVIRIGGRRS